MKLSDIDGLGPKTEEKLNEAGINDVLQLMSHSPREISDITGVDSDTASRWFRNARKFLQEQNSKEKSMKTASEIDEDRTNAKRIYLGCEPLDKMVGGFETGSMYEMYGEFGANKSQLCFSLMVRSQLPLEQGGVYEDKPVKVAVIDTEHTFRPSRIKDISKRWGLDEKQVLDNILVWSVRNSVEQQMALEEIENKIIEGENIKLVIIDSAIGLFRNEYIGRGSLSDRQGRINKFVGLASRTADVHKFCMVVTNQVQADPSMQFGDPTKPVGGNVIGHTSTYRIYLKKSGKNRIMRMIDSPNHADMEAMFRIGTGGAMSVEEADEMEEQKKKEVSKAKRAEKKKEDT